MRTSPRKTIDKHRQSWSTDNLMAPTDNLIIRLSMFVQVHWCLELLYFLFAWPREAYNLVSTDKTCHNAVSRIITWLAGAGLEIPSEDNSAYCQARKRLPEKLLQKLFIQVGNKLESKTSYEDIWCGRHVKVLDGSTVSMPDTMENQKAYPQPSSQKASCGFPHF